MTPAAINQFESTAQIFKALSHPARIAILEILRNGEECVCHLEAILGYRQAYLSQQLAVLREAGILADRRAGWNIFYRIVHPQILQILDLSRQCLPQEGQEIPPLQVKDCECPKCKRKDAPSAGAAQKDALKIKITGNQLY